jgi:hypothetical protein
MFASSEPRREANYHAYRDATISVIIAKAIIRANSASVRV